MMNDYSENGNLMIDSDFEVIRMTGNIINIEFWKYLIEKDTVDFHILEVI